MGQGAVRWTLQRKLWLSTKGDNRVSRRSSGATEARRGSRGDFSLLLKVAVFLIFVSVLEEGLQPKVLGINVS